MIPGSEVLKHIRWGVDNIRDYRRNDYFRITPKFLFSELISKSTRIAHYEDFSKYKENLRIEMFSPEEKTAIASAREFALREFKGIPDMTRFDLMDFAISNVDIDGIWLEFGVFMGKSINHIARTTEKTIHGFDSFNGLPEDWNRFFSRGHFSLESKLPKVASNVKLHAGWFTDTLPTFKEEIENAPIAFIHIDCDLYSSTKVVFTQLKENIVPGTVILFDEFYNYPEWVDHEYKAFNEFIRSAGLSFRYIGYNSKAEQVAVVIA